jgi:exosome complex RNA-binding protein Rrp4
MNNKTLARLIHGISDLYGVVGGLSNLYTYHPELNDQVDISIIIPKSLDEWELDIRDKLSELDEFISRQR